MGAVPRLASAAAALFLLLAGSTATAEDGTELLAKIQKEWTSRKSLTARFVQWQTFAGFDAPLESRGRMRILRPSYFEIAFEPPNKQLQVCDGTIVWTYTESMKQVIKVPLAPEATRSVDLLEWALSGASPIEAVPDTAFGGSCKRLLLEPGGHLPLSELTLWARPDGRLIAYEAVDAEGNRTRMRFLEIKEAHGLKPSDFRFVPPDGVEVVEMGSPR